MPITGDAITITIPKLAELKVTLKEFEDQLPFAFALSLTRTAWKAHAGLKAEMTKVFDRPTPWALGGLAVEMATKTTLQARVYMKDEVGWYGSASPRRFLNPQIHGGERRFKKFEAALHYRGILPSGMYIVPGAAVELDQYGNIPTGLIVKILSYFAAFTGDYAPNATTQTTLKIAKGTKNNLGIRYFAIKTAGRFKPGIYSVVANRVRPVFMFVKKPAYKPRYHFYTLGAEIANREWRPIFDQALTDAIATARD